MAQKWHNFLYALILPNINRFSKLFHYFTVRIRRQFAIIPSLKIPRNLSCVAILPCELSTPRRGHVIGGCPEVRGGVHPHPLEGVQIIPWRQVIPYHQQSSLQLGNAGRLWCVSLKTGGTGREQNLWGRHNLATRMKFCPLTTPEPLGLGSWNFFGESSPGTKGSAYLRIVQWSIFFAGKISEDSPLWTAITPELGHVETHARKVATDVNKCPVSKNIRMKALG